MSSSTTCQALKAGKPCGAWAVARVVVKPGRVIKRTYGLDVCYACSEAMQKELKRKGIPASDIKVRA